MTAADQPAKPKPGEAGTDNAKDKAGRQAADASTEGGKLDEGTRPSDLTSENDGGAEG